MSGVASIFTRPRPVWACLAGRGKAGQGGRCSALGLSSPPCVSFLADCSRQQASLRSHSRFYTSADAPNIPWPPDTQPGRRTLPLNTSTCCVGWLIAHSTLTHIPMSRGVRPRNCRRWSSRLRPNLRDRHNPGLGRTCGTDEMQASDAVGAVDWYGKCTLGLHFIFVHLLPLQLRETGRYREFPSAGSLLKGPQWSRFGQEAWNPAQNLPCGQQGPQGLALQLLPPRVHSSRKLAPGCSNTRQRHPRQWIHD